MAAPDHNRRHLAIWNSRGGEPVAPRLINEREAAAWLGIGRRTLWRLQNTGEIPVVRIGRAVRYDIQDLEAWLETHKSGKRA